MAGPLHLNLREIISFTTHEPPRHHLRVTEDIRVEFDNLSRRVSCKQGTQARGRGHLDTAPVLH